MNHFEAGEAGEGLHLVVVEVDEVGPLVDEAMEVFGVQGVERREVGAFAVETEDDRFAERRGHGGFGGTEDFERRVDVAFGALG